MDKSVSDEYAGSISWGKCEGEGMFLCNVGIDGATT
jgi:hypothetical protein